MAKLRRAEIDPALLRDKHVLITGGNSGLGRATAELCAGLGAQVTITARDTGRGGDVAGAIRARHPEARVGVLALELADASSVDACAGALLDRGRAIDVLCNNAGGVADGTLGAMFAGNVLGHVQLTDRLLPSLLASNGKVVNLSSVGHRHASLPRDDETVGDFVESGRGSSIGRYGFTKLCAIWHAVGLHRRHHESGLRTYAVHPGGIATEGFDKTEQLPAIARWGAWFYKNFVAERDVSLGAQTGLHCMANREADRESGLYYDDCRPVAALRGDDTRRIEELFAYCHERLVRAGVRGLG